MKLFNQFINLLNASSIPYAITGRTEDYPEKIGSDIDIVIPIDEMKDFNRFILSLDVYGIRCLQQLQHEAVASYFVITMTINDKHEIIKPDICSDYYRNGKKFIDAEYLLSDKVLSNKGFYQLSPVKEFHYYLMKKIDKGSINKEQFTHLLLQWNIAKTECIHAISKHFSKEALNIIENAFDHADICVLNNNKSKLKSDLQDNLNRNLLDVFSRFNNRIKRIFQPTGLVVAFMGPDGSGKSTIINNSKATIVELFRQTRYFHLFPKEALNNVVNTEPHAQVKRGFLLSVLKLIYFVFLYNVGYVKRIYPLKIRSTYVIFDRYYDDLLVDPIRYRNGAGNWITAFMSRFIPKPDMWILLDAEPHTILQRKNEVSFEECERQVKAYRELFKNLDNAYVIDANQNIDKVVFDVEEAVFKFMTNRTKKRISK